MDGLGGYFTGAIRQHVERGQGLLERVPTDLPAEFYPLAQTCQKELERILDELGELQKLLDGPPEELLRRFRRAVKDLMLIETTGIPPLERFHEKDDVFLNRLVRQVRSEIQSPLLPPVVSSLSKDYFHYYYYFNLLLVPLSEGNFLLHLPDLYHELAHPLLVEKHNPRVKLFQSAWLDTYARVMEYIHEEQQKEERRRSPRLFSYYLQQWENSWAGWLIEFFCDLFAVYAVGPAFAWSHLHLWVKLGHNPFEYPTYLPMSHPADDARMGAMLAGLRMAGFSQEALEIQSRWDAFLAISGFQPEPEYRRCFPTHLIEHIALKGSEGYQGMGCQPFISVRDGSVSAILNRAWACFWQDPLSYAAWERRAVDELRNRCAVGIQVYKSLP